MPARPRAECGVGAGGRASRRQAWEPQTARLEAQRLDALPLPLPRPPPLPGLWDERCVRRACAARGPRGPPGSGRGAGAAGTQPRSLRESWEHTEDGDAAASLFARGLCFSYTAGGGRGGEGVLLF